MSGRCLKLEDALLDLFEADSELVQVEGSAPDGAAEFTRHAIDKIGAARVKLELAARELEAGLYGPEAGKQLGS